MRLPTLDEHLVRRLVRQQFPEFANLPVEQIRPGGWDNASFRLGDRLIAKLPRAERYASQPLREREILRALSDRLPIQTPRQLGIGQPGEGYPFNWSLLDWIDGTTVAESGNHDIANVEGLAHVLVALHHPAHAVRLRPGPCNFWRGAPLANLGGDVAAAIDELSQKWPIARLHRLWDQAVDCPAAGAPVWVHGDIAPGNLILHNGRLVAIIDFGLAAVGDPACDLAIAWLSFNSRARRRFLDAYGRADTGLLVRARGWALWKALLMAAGRSYTPPGYRDCAEILDEILGETDDFA